MGKKRPKYSSQDLARKTKKAKAKKLRRYHDSDSDSYSTSSPSVSSDSYIRGGRLSNIPKDAKGTKRRMRKLVEPDQSKKKTIKMNKKKTTKNKKKNKSRRDDSISSTSQSDESDYESRRGRLRVNNLNGFKDVKISTSKKRIQYSSCSRERDSGSSDYGKLTDIGNNMPKRLRSVIIFIKDDIKEERELDHEIIYDYDDDAYPSTRSNDTYDGASKRISGIQSPVASENKNVKTEDDPFDIKTTQLSSRYLCGDVVEEAGKPASDDQFGTSVSLEDKAEHEIGKVNNDDLEIILRQKALENLKRFRGRNTATLKDESCGDSKLPHPIKADLSQNNPDDHCAKGVKGDTVYYLQEEIIGGKKGGNGSSTVENNVKVAVAERDKVNTTFRRGLNKQRLVTSALKQALSSCSPGAVEAPKVKLVAESGSGELNGTCVGGKTNSDKVNNAAAKSSTGVDNGLNRLQYEDGESSLVEQRSSTHDACGSNSAAQADDKEVSQLERKTMSVMQGGEMVQVSYKVYIPKKTPALARRQLKR